MNCYIVLLAFAICLVQCVLSEPTPHDTLYYTVECPVDEQFGSIEIKQNSGVDFVKVFCWLGNWTELLPGEVGYFSESTGTTSCRLVPKDPQYILPAVYLNGVQQPLFLKAACPTTTLVPTTTLLPRRTESVLKPGGPIVHLSADCPSKITGSPVLHLTSDVPAYAKANCKNSAEVFTTINDVDYYLPATFDQSNPGEHCLFYKKNGTKTFTVDVEVAWGEVGRQVMTYQQVRTISCAYDDHGNAMSSEETIADWFLAPREVQSLLGFNSTVTFTLKVLNVLNEEIDSDHIKIGRKIRLMATNRTGDVVGFRALSCVARGSNSSFSILRAGCGDGLVFPRTKGLYTEGNVVTSPFFDAFKLSDGDSMRFECTFTICTSGCNGSSCPTERKKRSRFSRRVRT